MAFKPLETIQGVVDFTNIDASAARTVPVGTVIRGVDALSGAGGGAEFIYLPGVAALVVGNMVTYNPVSKVCTLTANAIRQGFPIAVAMSANTTTTSYGWYQIAGVATIKKTAVKISPSVRVFQSATTGRVFATSTAGLSIFNAITVNAATVASATSTVQVLIQRPFLSPLGTV